MKMKVLALGFLVVTSQAYPAPTNDNSWEGNEQVTKMSYPTKEEVEAQYGKAHDAERLDSKFRAFMTQAITNTTIYTDEAIQQAIDNKWGEPWTKLLIKKNNKMREQAALQVKYENIAREQAARQVRKVGVATLVTLAAVCIAYKNRDAIKQKFSALKDWFTGKSTTQNEQAA